MLKKIGKETILIVTTMRGTYYLLDDPEHFANYLMAKNRIIDKFPLVVKLAKDAKKDAGKYKLINYLYVNPDFVVSFMKMYDEPVIVYAEDKIKNPDLESQTTM